MVLKGNQQEKHSFGGSPHKRHLERETGNKHYAVPVVSMEASCFCMTVSELLMSDFDQAAFGTLAIEVTPSTLPF